MSPLTSFDLLGVYARCLSCPDGPDCDRAKQVRAWNAADPRFAAMADALAEAWREMERQGHSAGHT